MSDPSDGGGRPPASYPSVSVVIPTRDRPELLRAAVAGALAQEYPGAIEVVVVHDQTAPDRSLQVDDPHRRVRVIGNDRTAGLAGARNTGILAATGELVAFCDDDDEWLPDKLRRQVAALVAAPVADLACCGIRVRYDDRTVDRVLDRERVPLAALLRSRLTELHPSTFLFRRDRLPALGLVDEDIPGSYGEDYEFLLRAARRGELVNVPAPLVLVRWHARSYFSRRWPTIVSALTWLLQRYPEFDGEPRGLARVAGQIAFASAAGGDRGGAVRWVRRTLRARLLEPRAWLALAVSTGVVSPERVLRALHRRGRGV